MEIPEELKAKIKEMAVGMDQKAFFDSYERNGIFAIAVYGYYPILADQVIIELDSRKEPIKQDVFVVEYRLPRSIIYEILRS